MLFVVFFCWSFRWIVFFSVVGSVTWFYFGDGKVSGGEAGYRSGFRNVLVFFFVYFSVVVLCRGVWGFWRSW